MITYRDMTFCNSWDECVWGSECHRSITDDVIDGAKEIRLPLSIAEKFECFKEME